MVGSRGSLQDGLVALNKACRTLINLKMYLEDLGLFATIYSLRAPYVEFRLLSSLSKKIHKSYLSADMTNYRY